MNWNKLMVMALATACLIVSGCQKEEYDDNPDNEYRPISLDTRQDACNEATKSFSFSLLKEFETLSAGGSYCFSPLSAGFALGLVAEGSKGETQKQILDALGIDNLGDLSSYAGTMLDKLPSIDKKSKVGLADLALYDSKVSLEKNYVSKVEKSYKALVKSMDFNSPKTTSFVNDWASRSTNGAIKNLLGDGAALAGQRFFLANALYFKGEWNSPFQITKKDSFYLESGKEIKVDMMETAARSCAFFESFSALMLQYGNGAYRMFVILPNKGLATSDIVDVLEEQMTDPKLLEWFGPSGVVRMPKFKAEYEFDLKGTLMKLGIKSMFDPSLADLGGMSSVKPLFVSLIKQKTFIEVNEKGTEAAAVTYTGMSMANVGGTPFYGQDFIADRPFLYLIEETGTGTILFMGKYAGE